MTFTMKRNLLYFGILLCGIGVGSVFIQPIGHVEKSFWWIIFYPMGSAFLLPEGLLSIFFPFSFMMFLPHLSYLVLWWLFAVLESGKWFSVVLVVHLLFTIGNTIGYIFQIPLPIESFAM